jgi:hypothetical protein
MKCKPCSSSTRLLQRAQTWLWQHPTRQGAGVAGASAGMLSICST